MGASASATYVPALSMLIVFLTSAATLASALLRVVAAWCWGRIIVTGNSMHYQETKETR
jgi:hypothetical protein